MHWVRDARLCCASLCCSEAIVRTTGTTATRRPVEYQLRPPLQEHEACTALSDFAMADGDVPACLECVLGPLSPQDRAQAMCSTDALQLMGLCAPAPIPLPEPCMAPYTAAQSGARLRSTRRQAAPLRTIRAAQGAWRAVCSVNTQPEARPLQARPGARRRRQAALCHVRHRRRTSSEPRTRGASRPAPARRVRAGPRGRAGRVRGGAAREPRVDA